MKLAALALVAVSAFAGVPRLTFTKSFPGSIPAYVSLTVDKSGSLQYKESSIDDQPLKAQMKETDAATLFSLAEKLGYFKSPLESGLKVANTGKKTFRYEDEKGAVTEVVFNYSLDETARQLLDRFEQIAATERAYINLDQTSHFDKLGVNDSLAMIEALWVRKELATPEQFIPLLTHITAHESYMHLVRERAARLKDEFLAGPVAVAPK
ncbi:MAG: hypothetical protein M3Y57_12950 [Acidobacteriota bacterium]|nr:hypothetical protein [Acidobacteriota bacterium]